MLILKSSCFSQPEDAAGAQECHSLDILTVAQPDGNIELMTVLYWGDCEDGQTTHTTRAGYVVDVANEKIGDNAKWYVLLLLLVLLVLLVLLELLVLRVLTLLPQVCAVFCDGGAGAQVLSAVQPGGAAAGGPPAAGREGDLHADGQGARARHGGAAVAQDDRLGCDPGAQRPDLF